MKIKIPDYIILYYIILYWSWQVLKPCFELELHVVHRTVDKGRAFRKLKKHRLGNVPFYERHPHP